MPNLSAGRQAELKARGIEAISAVPDDFPLSPRQMIIRDVVRTGKPFLSPELGKHLRKLGPPSFYLDFETFLPTIPLYAGTRPYQTIPFQWSLHQIDADGSTSHQEFLADASADPRRHFTESLLAALKSPKWPIIVYSSYEQSRLKELAGLFPDLARPINAVLRRIVDLLHVVRTGIYHPEFGFSYSIKSAAPAVCADVTYDDLEEIADGGSASTAFWLMATGRVDDQRSGDLRKSLRAYCQRDTWAMVRLHQALQALAGSTAANSSARMSSRASKGAHRTRAPGY